MDRNHPAVSANAAAACLEAVKTASDMGITISCDLNYRAKLWKWGKTANEVMEELVSYCDIAIGNEEDAEKVFGIQAPETDITQGKVTADKYQFVCEALAKKFEKLKTICDHITEFNFGIAQYVECSFMGLWKDYILVPFMILPILLTGLVVGIALWEVDLWVINIFLRSPKSLRLCDCCFSPQAHNFWRL